jgi:hypothetical protein
MRTFDYTSDFVGVPALLHDARAQAREADLIAESSLMLGSLRTFACLRIAIDVHPKPSPGSEQRYGI